MLRDRAILYIVRLAPDICNSRDFKCKIILTAKKTNVGKIIRTQFEITVF